MNGTKKIMLILFAAILGGGLLFFTPVFSHGPGSGGGGYWNCPMWGGGQGQGRHMMGSRMHGQDHPMMGSQMQGQQAGQPVTKQEANYILNQYLRNTNNPNLKLGDISEEKEYFVGQVLTKNGSLVDNIQVDKQTGWYRSAYSE